MKWSYFVLNPHSDGKFSCPINISGASQQNGVPAFSLTTEAPGDFFRILLEILKHHH